VKIRTLAISLLLAVSAVSALAQDKVAYHLQDTASQATNTLRNIKNHLDADPTAQIIVVAHAQGVETLMLDATDRNGNPYAISVEELSRRGVKFEVCEITLKNLNLKREQFIPEASFTPSGPVRLTRLQTQGFGYLKF
jgi:uncharacterized protein